MCGGGGGTGFLRKILMQMVLGESWGRRPGEVSEELREIKDSEAVV